MQNIYLVGFMGTGKTAVGKRVAHTLNRPFLEMDTLIEERQGKKIVDIFAQEGEGFFRKLEKELLAELSRKNGFIISCGGGLICNEQNLKILENTGIVIGLFASPSVIYERTKDTPQRPLLNVPDPMGKIKHLLAKRTPFYQQAHYTIDTDQLTLEEVANKIVEIVNKTDSLTNSHNA